MIREASARAVERFVCYLVERVVLPIFAPSLEPAHPSEGINMMNRAESLDLADVFRHHAPKSEEQAEKFQRIRDAALTFARVIDDECPRCADKAAAFRKVRDAMFTANASIALDGLV